MKKILIFALFLTYYFSYSQDIDLFLQKEKLSKVLTTIKYNYVDTVNEKKLVEEAIKAMLKELDPHSVYFNKKELEEANEPLQGNFEGIGIQFFIVKDTIVVVAPIPGGPSEKLGIMAGDKIVKIEGENVASTGITNNDVIKSLRGPKGTQVNITVYRNGEFIDFTITRDKIPIFSVDASYIIKPGIAYIKINRFARTTIKEYEEAFNKLKKKGFNTLILDLTGNPGGYLHVAIQLADEFLSDGKLIVYTQGLHQTKQVYKATANGNYEKGMLIILIDEGSASASEIVSGAIQDWDRGILIGRRTFGKGLVQRTYSLADGSAIRLTTARYYTPSGRWIQKPYNKGADEYYKEIYERYKHGELEYKDSIKFPDSLKFYTNKKRLVFGGGGIMPDFFVPIDTTYNSKFYTKLRQKGLMHNYVLQYLDKERSSLLNKYKNVKEFKKNYQISTEFINDFFNFLKDNKLEIDKKGYEKSEYLIKLQLKALIARNLWNSSSYYEIINDINPIVQKALEKANDKTFKQMNLEY